MKRNNLGFEGVSDRKVEVEGSVESMSTMESKEDNCIFYTQRIRDLAESLKETKSQPKLEGVRIKGETSSRNIGLERKTKTLQGYSSKSVYSKKNSPESGHTSARTMETSDRLVGTPNSEALGMENKHQVAQFVERLLDYNPTTHGKLTSDIHTIREETLSSHTHFINIQSGGNTKLLHTGENLDILNSKLKKLKRRNLELELNQKVQNKKLKDQFGKRQWFLNELYNVEKELDNEDEIMNSSEELNNLHKINNHQNSIMEDLTNILANSDKSKNQLMNLVSNANHELSTYKQILEKWANEAAVLSAETDDITSQILVYQGENLILMNEYDSMKNDKLKLTKEYKRYREKLQVMPVIETVVDSNRDSFNPNFRSSKRESTLLEEEKAQIEHYRQIYEQEKTANLKLMRERDKLQEALRREHMEKVQTDKDIMELAERLNFVESKMKEADGIRIKVQDHISEKQYGISTAVKRLAANEGFIKICSNYLEDQGVLTSSDSESDNLEEEDYIDGNEVLQDPSNYIHN